jgi:hypothetical protein
MRNRARTGCLIAFAIAVVVALSARAEQTDLSKSNMDNPGTAQTHNPSEKAVEEPQSPAPYVAARKQQNASDAHNYEWWAKFFNDLKVTDVLLTIFTGVLAVYTAALFYATRELWKAGERQIIHLEATAKRQLRAYVFIQSAEVRLVNNDTAVMALMVLKNFGQTPGYQFKTWTNIRIGDINEQAFGERKPAAQDSIIGPSADLSAPSQFIPITQAERDAVNSGTKKIYVWGEAVYTDAFGTGRKFIYKGYNSGLEVVVNENITGRVLWRGWGLNPRGYEETKLSEM